MLDIHRTFAKESFFGFFQVIGTNSKIETIESEVFKKIKDSKLIDFTTFVHFMITDEVVHSYCSDIGVSDFANNLIRRYEYYGQDLEWDISMIDIEILFNSLREHGFIEGDTPRDNFFAIFNPHVETFKNPVVWKDIKELVYFFDKCIEYGFIKNSKYQSFIEEHKMFKTINSKGEYIKSNSLRTTLADVKNESLKTQKFIERTKLIDEFLDYIEI